MQRPGRDPGVRLVAATSETAGFKPKSQTAIGVAHSSLRSENRGIDISIFGLLRGVVPECALACWVGVSIK